MTTDKRHREILAEEIRKHYPDGGDWEAETVLAGGDPGYGVAAALAAMSRASEVPGWKLVPVEPTPEMIAATLPTASVALGCSTNDWRLVETALSQIEPPDITNGDHIQGVNAGLELLRDYRAMLASAPTPPHNEGE